MCDGFVCVIPPAVLAVCTMYRLLGLLNIIIISSVKLLDDIFYMYSTMQEGENRPLPRGTYNLYDDQGETIKEEKC